MRVAIGGYIAAVNSFVNYRMDLGMFQRSTLTGDAVLKMGRGETAISGFLDVAEQNGWEAVPLPFSVPGVWGKVTTEAHEWLKEQFLTALRKAGKIDGVFLQIHGTEAVENVADGEGDFGHGEEGRIQGRDAGARDCVELSVQVSCGKRCEVSQ